MKMQAINTFSLLAVYRAIVERLSSVASTDDSKTASPAETIVELLKLN
jgi:hypothetical protein